MPARYISYWERYATRPTQSPRAISNSLYDEPHRPFLGPLEIRDPTALSSAEKMLLEHYYCELREARVDQGAGQDPATRLWAFMSGGQGRFCILHGRRGIGKSLFVRYTLAKELPKRKGRLTVVLLDAISCVESDLRAELHGRLHSALDKSVNDRDWLLPALKTWATRSLRDEQGIAVPGEEDIRAEISRIVKKARDDLPTLTSYNIARAQYLTEKVRGQILFVLDNLDLYGRDTQLEVARQGSTYVNAIPGGLLLAVLREGTYKAYWTKGALQQFASPVPIDLPRVDIVPMLDLRFSRSREGTDLKTTGLSTDETGGFTTMYAVWESIRESETLNLLRKLAHGDCRTLLQLVDRILYARNLDPSKMFRHFSALEVLLQPQKEAHWETNPVVYNLFGYPSPCVTNDTHEGCALLRFRVLEYFRYLHPIDKYFRQYFKRLGYMPAAVERVVAELFEVGLIEPIDWDKRLSAGSFTSYEMSPLGKAYMGELLREYRYAFALRDYVKLPAHFLRERGGLKFETFVEAIEWEEDLEKKRIQRQVRRHPSLKLDIDLQRVSGLLKAAQEKAFPKNPNGREEQRDVKD